MKRAAALLALVLALPLAFGATTLFGQTVPWYDARRDSSGQAPDPATTKEAVIQVYAARAVRWRGIFAVHSWIAVKPGNADRYTRYEVVGFGVSSGAPAIRVDRMGPDNYWFGAYPELLLDRRGIGVDVLIDKVKAAVDTYPWPQDYTTWPGPNSNTFIAWIGRNVPELRLEMPPTAIGKDFLGLMPVAVVPSGTGAQVSLFGLLGGMLALDEGVEINLLGMVFGIDVASPALKLPLIGRIGMAQN